MLYVFFQLTYTIYNCETTYWFTVWRFKTNCQFKCNSNSISRKWTLRSTRIRVNISLQFHFNELYNLFISVYQLPKPPWKLSIWLVAVKCVESALLFDFVTFSSPKDLSRRFPSGPVFFVSNFVWCFVAICFFFGWLLAGFGYSVSVEWSDLSDSEWSDLSDSGTSARYLQQAIVRGRGIACDQYGEDTSRTKPKR